MVSCPKCGSYSISQPMYDRLADCLNYTCHRCGFSKSTPPRDACRRTQPPSAAPSTREGEGD